MVAFTGLEVKEIVDWTFDEGLGNVQCFKGGDGIGMTDVDSISIGGIVSSVDRET